MAKINSLFHDLQSKGERALEVFDVKAGYKLNLKPFIDKISNRLRDPFPVYKNSAATLSTVRNRFHQILATEGLPVTDDMPVDDKIAAYDLFLEESLKAALPARRFGVEITSPQSKTLGMVFEAMRAIHVPYSLEESAGKKLSECQYLRIHFLTPTYGTQTSDGRQSVSSSAFVLNNAATYLSIPEMLSPKNEPTLQLAVLGEDAFTVKTMPPGKKPVVTQDVFNRLPSPSEFPEYGKTILPLVIPVFHLLWVLARDPKLIISEIEENKAANQSRRDRGLRPYSPVQTILIDEEEWRRRESHRAEEIADALSKTGGYKIPGLVLAAAYARCGDEVVRKKATALLRKSDFENLATLLQEFDGRATQAKPEQSGEPGLPKSHNAAEIADALLKTGSYTVSGLALIGAYARCEDEVVRLEATGLLRSKNFEKLAELVQVLGAPTTKAKLEHSTIYVPRIV